MELRENNKTVFHFNPFHIFCITPISMIQKTYNLSVIFGQAILIERFLFWFRGCYFQKGMEVKVEMQVENAYKHSIQTVRKWIQDRVNPNKTQIFFRTLAPVHFRFVWRFYDCNGYSEYKIFVKILMNWCEMFQSRRLEKRWKLSFGNTSGVWFFTGTKWQLVTVQNSKRGLICTHGCFWN